MTPFFFFKFFRLKLPAAPVHIFPLPTKSSFSTFLVSYQTVHSIHTQPLSLSENPGSSASWPERAHRGHLSAAGQIDISDGLWASVRACSLRA